MPHRTTLERLAVLLMIGLTLGGSAPRDRPTRLASGIIEASSTWPYFPGSSIPLKIDGFSAPYHASLLGPGRLLPDGTYEIPEHPASDSALLVAGNAHGLAAARLRIASPPPRNRSLLAVASYNDGVVLHDERSFAVFGVLATGGTPSDTAIDSAGRIAATDTQGSQLTLATLAPWNVTRIDRVSLGDEVAIDDRTASIFVTNRDVDGKGALTRVTRDATVTRVLTGTTAEGLAIDSLHHLVYVANTNDGTVAVVDSESMRMVRRFNAVARVFSLALSPDGTRLYAISNQSAGSAFASPGSAVAIDLRPPAPRIVARSAKLTFPLGVALDSMRNTLFVTDEELNRIDILDARTLLAKHSPLTTCATPWKPSYDPIDRRLYVPCAGADAVDVFDALTLHRVAGAPFRTGGYPLAVAIWHPAPR